MMNYEQKIIRISTFKIWFLLIKEPQQYIGNLLVNFIKKKGRQKHKYIKQKRNNLSDTDKIKIFIKWQFSHLCTNKCKHLDEMDDFSGET